MAHIELTIKEIAEEQAEIWIAKLDLEGFTGFEQTGNELIACIPVSDCETGRIEKIMEGSGLSFDCRVLEHRNWNSEWESSYQPVTVAGNGPNAPLVHVRASFHPSMENATYQIEINPKMSFGTGHHATTSMMMEGMSQTDLKDKRVVDFGTGTGILAILAEKMGAASILATDNDPQCIENARENNLLNGCSKIDWQLSNVFPDQANPDVVLANINLNVLMESLPAMSSGMAAGTIFLFSGILISDENQFVTALSKNKISVSYHMKKGDWMFLSAYINA